MELVGFTKIILGNCGTTFKRSQGSGAGNRGGKSNYRSQQLRSASGPDFQYLSLQCQADVGADVSVLERKIDELVNVLYGLTPEGIRLVKERARK